MTYIVHEFLSYLCLVVLALYTWWGWTLFDQLDDIEHPWTRWVWLGGMSLVILAFAIFMLI